MKPDFVHENFEWYLDKYHTNYALTENANNLPALKNVGCFQVKNIHDNSISYVMIDNQQNVLIDKEGLNSLEAFICSINILKIAKYYDESETICKRESGRFV